MSRASDIWWERLGASLKLKSEIRDAMRAGESLTVHLPAGLPWSECLYDFIKDNAASLDANRGIKLIEDDTASEAGDTMLLKLCGQDVAVSYWPGSDYGEFLCANPGYAVHTYMVWVKNIETPERLRDWQKLVSSYEAAAENKDLENRAQFLLEYRAPSLPKGVKSIVYSITQADMKVFCYSMTQSKNQAVAVYAAELASRACGGDPLVCERLLSNEAELTEFPMDFIGRDDEKRVHSAVWEAQITLCFPRLERARLELVEKYGAELRKLLPVKNGFGDIVRSIEELEFADIVHLISENNFRLPKTEYDNLCEYRRMRNELAHNKLLSLQDVMRLLK